MRERSISRMLDCFVTLTLQEIHGILLILSAFALTMYNYDIILDIFHDEDLPRSHGNSPWIATQVKG